MFIYAYLPTSLVRGGEAMDKEIYVDEAASSGQSHPRRQRRVGGGQMEEAACERQRKSSQRGATRSEGGRREAKQCPEHPVEKPHIVLQRAVASVNTVACWRCLRGGAT